MDLMNKDIQNLIGIFLIGWAAYSIYRESYKVLKNRLEVAVRDENYLEAEVLKNKILAMGGDARIVLEGYVG